MHGAGRERRQADRDILGALIARSAVAHPFALMRDDGLARVDLQHAGTGFDAQRTAQYHRILVELGRLTRLLPAAGAGHVRNTNRFGAGVDASDVLGDPLGFVAGERNDGGLWNDVGHTIILSHSAGCYHEGFPSMVHTIPDILARIVDRKRAALAGIRAQRGEFERAAAARAEGRTEFRDFRAALNNSWNGAPAIIAEIKKASPSRGVFTERFDPASIAVTYAAGGAAALSVLTDQEFFHGSMEDLEAARAATGIPVLRKDFTIDELHVIEAAAHGADAILLIAAILDEAALRRLRELAAAYRMAALVEVHDADELESALASGAGIVGVNNRNLHTFEVALETSLQLADRIPLGVVRVTESGIHSSTDVARLRAAGYHAFLVGEHLMKSADPAAAIRALRS
jgi:indole-3-glycerol phosphate synthase